MQLDLGSCGVRSFREADAGELALHANNAASCRVLEKAGYRLEGRMRRSAIKDGVVQDQLLYSILRGEAAMVES